ncbi:hypothetical protein ACROYT_G014080 [Oculina patagonica]
MNSATGFKGGDDDVNDDDEGEDKHEDGPLEPKRRNGKIKEMLEINKKVKEKEVLLIGDSITKHMERFATNFYEYFPAYTVLNAGIAGYTVEAILYRVEGMDIPSSVKHIFAIPLPYNYFFNYY